MKRIIQHQITKIIGFSIVFMGLVLAYMYFREQSLLSQGFARAEIVMQDVASGDPSGLEQQLYEINGVDKDSAEDLPGLQRALRNIDYVSALLADAKQSATFVGQRIERRSKHTYYAAVYTIPDQRGGEDYVLVTCLRGKDEKGAEVWHFSDLALSATNPLEAAKRYADTADDN